MKDVTGVAEFRSIPGEAGVDDQINEWLQKYPQVSVVDVKYHVVPYADGGNTSFASFALVTYDYTAQSTGGSVNRAMTQQMTIPQR